MSADLVKFTSYQELYQVAATMAASKMFPGVYTKEIAVAKIIAGIELGIGPAAALRGINIIQGNPELSSGLIASLIKQSGKYNYKVIIHDREQACIEFTENGQLVGSANFTIEDAKAAELDFDSYTNSKGKTVVSMFRKYPEAMLFWRAMTKGARMFCPDVFIGTVYHNGEINESANVDESNEMIETTIAHNTEEVAFKYEFNTFVEACQADKVNPREDASDLWDTMCAAKNSGDYVLATELLIKLEEWKASATA